MKNSILFLFASILLFGFTQKTVQVPILSNPTIKTQWDDANYAKSYETFCNSVDVNQPIDFTAIDYILLQACVFYETNQQRILNDVPPLNYSKALETAASGHANDMTKFNFFSHTSVVPGKKDLTDRVDQVEFAYWGIGENIAQSYGLDLIPETPVYTPEDNNGYFSYEYEGQAIQAHTYLSFAKAVVQQWMDSEGHRENILDPSYQFLGIGCSHYLNESFYDMDMFHAVQVFGY